MALHLFVPNVQMNGKKTLSEENNEAIIKDTNGNILNNGDSITIIKDQKVKGSSSVIKVGTKVKNIGSQ
jgi:protein PhnA